MCVCFLDALPGDVWFVLLCCSEVLPVSVLGQALRFDSDEQLTVASPACARGSRSPPGQFFPLPCRGATAVIITKIASRVGAHRGLNIEWLSILCLKLLIQCIVFVTTISTPSTNIHLSLHLCSHYKTHHSIH